MSVFEPDCGNFEGPDELVLNLQDIAAIPKLSSERVDNGSVYSEKKDESCEVKIKVWD